MGGPTSPCHHKNPPHQNGCHGRLEALYEAMQTNPGLQQLRVAQCKAVHAEQEASRVGEMVAAERKADATACELFAKEAEYAACADPSTQQGLQITRDLLKQQLEDQTRNASQLREVLASEKAAHAAAARELEGSLHARGVQAQEAQETMKSLQEELKAAEHAMEEAHRRLESEQAAVAEATVASHGVEMRMKQGLRGAALRHLGVLLSHLLRGAQASALHAIRLGLAAHRHRHAEQKYAVSSRSFDRVKEDLRRTRKHSAVRELRNAFWLLVKGSLATRLRCWCVNAGCDSLDAAHQDHVVVAEATTHGFPVPAVPVLCVTYHLLHLRAVNAARQGARTITGVGT